MNIKIESRMPKPNGRGGVTVYPFAEMGVGDSFFLPAGDLGATAIQRKVAAAAGGYGSKRGMKFSTRQVEGGVRCWRDS